MTRKAKRKSADAEPTRGAASGYRKGDETRARILGAALREFGNDGFAAVTTRQIAKAAEVNLPALTYYFGNKEGLYLACAHEIVASWREGVGAVAAGAHAALREPLTPADARARLRQLMAALARFLLASEGAQNRTLFVQREMASPGLAFEILYAELWRPGIELAAALLAEAAGGRLDATAAKIRAILMISSLTGFLSGQAVIDRAVGKAELPSLVLAALDEQIDALACD